MPNKELDKTTLLDFEHFQAELREVHRLMQAYNLEHYWNVNIKTFADVAVPILKKQVQK